jgi:hypothetical protein
MDDTGDSRNIITKIQKIYRVPQQTWYPYLWFLGDERSYNASYLLFQILEAGVWPGEDADDTVMILMTDSSSDK